MCPRSEAVDRSRACRHSGRHLWRCRFAAHAVRLQSGKASRSIDRDYTSVPVTCDFAFSVSRQVRAIDPELQA